MNAETRTPRSIRTRRAVLAATVALLTEGGVPAATIDAIRDRSGVSKTTIYKHWPGRLCVAVDAFTEQLELSTDLPDTGTARGDLTEQAKRVTAFYRSPFGAVLVQLLAACAQDPVASGWLGERFTASRDHGVEQLWARAVERGEVRADIDPDVAMDLLFGPLMWRIVSGRESLGDDEAAQLLDAALSGLLA
ncbi:TetR/AcrR family transcriptional regulator [soil metagenome]